MTFLSDADRRRIEEAVVAAELRTTGELVTVIADRSGHYLYLPTMIAAATVLALSGVLLLLPIALTFEIFYVGQVVGFIALFTLLSWTPVRMRLVPRSAARRQARLLAHEQFLDLGLSSTAQRTGVMLFVSVAEHYVEIIVDAGIQARIDTMVWRTIVDAFVRRVQGGRAADGFVEAIDACAGVLAEHFPWQEGDRNELPNRLIEIRTRRHG